MEWPRQAPRNLDYFGLALDVAAGRSAEVSSAIDSFEFEMAGRLLQPGDRAVVAGCGLGSVALWAAHLLGVEQVTAYEPNLLLHRLVTRHVRVGGRPLDVRHAALADKSGRRDFLCDLDHWSRSHLAAPSLWTHRDGFQRFTVDAVGVNQALGAANVLLLDVEGAEHEILPVLDWGRLRLLIAELHGSRPEREHLLGLIREHLMVAELWDGYPCPDWTIVAALRP